MVHWLFWIFVNTAICCAIRIVVVRMANHRHAAVSRQRDQIRAPKNCKRKQLCSYWNELLSQLITSPISNINCQLWRILIKKNPFFSILFSQTMCMPRRSRVSKSIPFKMSNASRLANHWFWRAALMFPILIWYPICDGEDKTICQFYRNSKYWTRKYPGVEILRVGRHWAIRCFMPYYHAWNCRRFYAYTRTHEFNLFAKVSISFFDFHLFVFFFPSELIHLFVFARCCHSNDRHISV